MHHHMVMCRQEYQEDGLRQISMFNWTMILSDLLPLCFVVIAIICAALTAVAHHSEKTESWNGELLYFGFLCDAIGGTATVPTILSSLAMPLWPQSPLPATICYFSVFITNIAIGAGTYMNFVEVLTNCASIFKWNKLSEMANKVRVAIVIFVAYFISAMFRVSGDLLIHKVVNESGLYYLRLTEFYYSELSAILSTVNSYFDYALNGVAYILSIVLAIRLTLMDDSSESVEASRNRRLAIMVCIQTATILVLDSAELLLATIYSSFPNLSECDPIEEQIQDFRLYWPHLYSVWASNILEVMKIGYYFFPAVAFDHHFREALQKAISSPFFNIIKDVDTGNATELQQEPEVTIQQTYSQESEASANTVVM